MLANKTKLVKLQGHLMQKKEMKKCIFLPIRHLLLDRFMINVREVHYCMALLKIGNHWAGPTVSDRL